ncbi:hypothetical protein [Flavobacterium sharifuzzamanii]|uniref:hypothetical protein n=1 Tax=Flavobacterium sharifuzzamanii TaxID=2211133 RepID=UPI000DAE15A1|nr:hypothetical protein [Flavobacterium sharifuzzamanii]KAF2078925.1 hypothetical protein DMA14_20770 [Flavobacterium sharifuzzamanii]
MKNILFIAFFILLVNYINAQKVNVYAKNSYVEDNLDLNAVASIFEESKDLVDFEQKLNYPQDRISNLDLNNDGKVDYLKVSDKIVNNIQIIKIQSEVSPNIYEDVASINIILNNKNRSSNFALNTTHCNEIPNKNKEKNKSSYYNQSGLRATDIVIPFIYTALNVYLSIRR